MRYLNALIGSAVPVLACAGGIAWGLWWRGGNTEKLDALQESKNLIQTDHRRNGQTNFGIRGQWRAERAEDVLLAVLSTPIDDLLGIADGIRRLTALSDSEAQDGFGSLAGRPKRHDYVGSLVAAYLWSRVATRNPETPMPQGWDLEQYPSLASGLKSSGDLETIKEDILAGRPVSFEDRKLFFSMGLRSDPIGTFGIWLNKFSGEIQLDEMAWFRSIMVDPNHRAAAIEVLLHAQLVAGDTIGVIDRISADWMLLDPEGYEAWLNHPQLAPFRDALLQLYATRRCESDPSKAWSLSDLLPDGVRVSARLRGCRNLAETNPDVGIQRLSEVVDPNERGPLVRGFSESLAIYQYDRWRQWRDSLSMKERDAANEASFETWVGRDVQGALAWLQTQPDGAVKSGLVAETATRFAREQPEAVAAWIRSLPEPDARLRAAIAGIRAMPSDAFNDIRTLLNAAK